MKTIARGKISRSAPLKVRYITMGMSQDKRGLTPFILLCLSFLFFLNPLYVNNAYALSRSYKATSDTMELKVEETAAESLYRKNYVPGRYRTIVIAIKGGVVVSDYDEKGPKIESSVEIAEGQKIIRTGEIKASTSAQPKKRSIVTYPYRASSDRASANQPLRRRNE